MKRLTYLKRKPVDLSGVLISKSGKVPLAPEHGSENYERALRLAIKTLGLYADPKSYHAITIIPDRPAGWFADDFSYDRYYKRKMPGAAARRAIVKIERLILPNDGDKA